MAQQIASVPPTPPIHNWGAGFGIGNGLEIHAGYLRQHLLLLGRSRYKWWGPDSGPGSSGWIQHFNTRSRQFEIAALAGYSVRMDRGLAYAAGGVGYVAGRQLGEYRYTLRGNGFITDDRHYYAYRSYQAIGLPLEVGFISPLVRRHLGMGLAFQANLNPEHSVYCLLLTLWGGQVGTVPTQP